MYAHSCPPPTAPTLAPVCSYLADNPGLVLPPEIAAMTATAAGGREYEGGARGGEAGAAAAAAPAGPAAVHALAERVEAFKLESARREEARDT